MRILFIFIFFSLFCVNSLIVAQSDNLSPSLKDLYQIIDRKEIYVKEKEKKIEEIKNRLKLSDITKQQEYLTNRELYNEYQSFISDSAVLYVRRNLEIATELNGIIWIYDSSIALSYMYSLSGKYFDAQKLLNGLDRNEFKNLPEWLLTEYYGAYKSVYKSYYSLDEKSEEHKQYLNLSNAYRDSLMLIVDKNSYFYKILYAEKLSEEGKLEEAKNSLLEICNDTENHGKAIVATVLANIYGLEGDVERQKELYIISAINDIEHSVKENTSMRELALILYKDGDIDNAYKCIESSMEDAMFCNAHLRTFEVSKIFPIINYAYKEKISKQKDDLKKYLLLVSLLSVFLIMSLVYVYSQMKRIAKIRKTLSDTNSKLSKLNIDLQNSITQLYELNDELFDTNSKLNESNLIKETYLGRFIDLCSSYIEKIENYRRHLGKIAQTGKVQSLYDEIKSTSFTEGELNDFYKNFDETFLNLYPTFVSDFNNLFPEEERQTLKPSELLNTELRVFALIRLGINDSSKIANFLRCSIATVYTYRSKLKNKSLNKENFENLVMKIGSFS